MPELPSLALTRDDHPELITLDLSHLRSFGQHCENAIERDANVGRRRFLSQRARQA
jgi:hypothetical protein